MRESGENIWSISCGIFFRNNWTIRVLREIFIFRYDGHFGILYWGISKNFFFETCNVKKQDILGQLFREYSVLKKVLMGMFNAKNADIVRKFAKM